MPLHVSSTTCSSSGGQNCIIQHLVSSHSVGGRPVDRLRADCISIERLVGTRERLPTRLPIPMRVKHTIP